MRLRPGFDARRRPVLGMTFLKRLTRSDEDRKRVLSEIIASEAAQRC